ncbi:phage shock protein C (PspC) family protein [Hymenobacter roseosalivarius DSM 11622]|uniref:Phage shock protein C (PspC) family protein n=1 Tax=Hymenobacter roseosalivarius DSM 11622 TaxID=645990 RepID=A0A1W1VXV1_9BACT|nr:PspC domain-containing protein [Hymenobacter roseosalivarius]SMB98212.1 phage shock protein C (PspC) family protein [Hymenobacter roseosalivarius DSM 11622]
MKKNISINLQGIIFHIEEDGYDVLSRYLAEVKAHFSGYRGHEEIVADIESRIAELFVARLSPTKQIISLEDVEAMTAKMGRVRDFQAADDAEDDEELLASAVNSGTAAGTYARPEYAYNTTGAGAGAASATAAEPRRLFRDVANKKIAGVCAGLAHYFGINAVWVRLIALASLFSIVIGDFVGALPAFTILAYVILWAVLPKRNDLPDPVGIGEATGERKLFRDTDTGKIGGISSGLAAYFKADVTLIRILFVLSLFTGFGLLLYLLLWVVLPEARTVSEKMRMRGDAVTLSGIDNSLRNNAFEAGGMTGSGRQVGTFLEELARNLRPLVNFLGSLIRVFAGVLLVIIGFSMLLGLTIALGIGLGMIPATNSFMTGDIPAHIFLNGVPIWAMFAFYLTAAIPFLALLLAGLSLLLRRSILTRTVGLTLLGLWLLGVVGTSIGATRISHDFQEEADVTQNQSFPTLRASSIYLDIRGTDQSHDQWVNARIAAVDSNQVVSVDKTYRAEGATEEQARQTAATSVAYTVRQVNDTTLRFDDHFTFRPSARYRDQEVNVTLKLPRNRTVRLSQGAAHWLGSDNFVDNDMPKNVEQHLYRLTGNRLECVDCTPDDLHNTTDENEDEDGEVNIDIDEDEEDGDVNVSLDYGGAPSFSTNADDYGSGRESYNVEGFREVTVLGSYRTVIRSGDTFRVTAAGPARELRDLKIDRDGDELMVRSRNRSLFSGNWGRNQDRDKVLITIEMPALDKLDLAGAVRADVSGFTNQSTLEVDQAGASHLRLNGDYRSLNLDLAGACRTTLQGRADRLEVDGAGACELAAARFTARAADVDLAGMSKARLRVEESLRADAVGASVIEYSGNPGSVKVSDVGASRITRINE